MLSFCSSLPKKNRKMSKIFAGMGAFGKRTQGSMFLSVKKFCFKENLSPDRNGVSFCGD